jgi:DNA-binding MarR family transcriptional regulator
MLRTRAPTPTQLATGQRKPFTSQGHEIAVAVLLAARLVHRRLAALVEPEGVTTQQYNVLRILRGAGRAGLPTLTIADRLLEQTPGVTRLLDRLEAKGLIRRERCAEDRRQVLCFLTPGGRDLLARLDEPVRRSDRGVGAGLSQRQRDTLLELLTLLREGAA